MRQAEYEFAECVAEIHKNQQKNELVEWTKNYIYQNLHSDIVIGEIGQKIGVNTSYLSDLFHKVEGTTIQQYICKEKIRLAENMLRYSDYEVKCKLPVICLFVLKVTLEIFSGSRQG